ncbi:MAG TPA: Clp protease N-terminal domain-containing protein [Gemmataceae bacterium]|jgi:hypothetical protein
MYERFTDRALKVLHLANQEAHRFDHEYIGTEHMLLGLIKEGAGVAAHVLMNLDLDVFTIRLEIEKIILFSPFPVTMGQLPRTPRFKSAIEHAIKEAKNLHHDYVGTEHLLLGLVRDEESVAAQVLMNLGLKLSDVRKEVLNLLGRNTASEGIIDCGTVYLSRPLMGPPSSQEIAREDSCRGSAPGEASLSVERERIHSLERQMWNVRVVLGALVGALVGVLLAAGLGVVLGSIIGGGVAALGWRIPAALIGGGTGALLGSAHLPSDGGGLAGALLGALAGILIAEIGGAPERRGFANLWRR